MGKRTSYQPGTFCAVDLATTDPAAAKSFYRALFGWEGKDLPMDDGAKYTALTLGGDYVAGLYPQPEQQRTAGVPPHWFSYVSVTSADDAAARAAEMGGTVHAGPIDVMNAGRMAVVADPTGAMFGAWEARESNGAERVNDPGCLTTNELSTNDVARATEFYSGLFGWKIEELDTGGGMRYWAIGHDGAAQGRNGGMRELAPEQAGVPPHWMPYFAVESVDGAIATAQDAGGGVLAGPIDIPTGARLAVLRDPQAAIFAIFEGEADE